VCTKQLKSWTESENIVLQDLGKTYEQLRKMLPHRTKNAIKCQCYKLKLTNRPNTRCDSLFQFNMTYEEADYLCEDKEFCEMLNGSLLGDACVNSKGLRFNSSNREYLQYLSDYFSPLLKCKGTIRPYVKNGKYQLYELSLRCRIVLQRFRDRWYPNGTKTVPRDIVLTPLVCLCWYIDDGALWANPGDGVRISLQTQCFTLNEIHLLCEQLNMKLGISSYPAFNRIGSDGEANYTIQIGGSDVILFLDYIGPCPVLSYMYKWNVHNYRRIDFSCYSCGRIVSYFGFSHTDNRKTCGRTECVNKYTSYYNKKKRNLLRRY